MHRKVDVLSSLILNSTTYKLSNKSLLLVEVGDNTLSRVVKVLSGFGEDGVDSSSNGAKQLVPRSSFVEAL
jgi:hypothetical protein